METLKFRDILPSINSKSNNSDISIKLSLNDSIDPIGADKNGLWAEDFNLTYLVDKTPLDILEKFAFATYRREKGKHFEKYYCNPAYHAHILAQLYLRGQELIKNDTSKVKIYDNFGNEVDFDNLEGTHFGYANAPSLPNIEFIKKGLETIGQWKLMEEWGDFPFKAFFDVSQETRERIKQACFLVPPSMVRDMNDQPLVQNLQ